MALDTYSTYLGLILMGTGNNNNSWGTIWNTSAGAIIDRAVAGRVSRVLTGGTLDLSGSPPPAAPRQDLDMIQDISGTLTSNQTIIVPNLAKTWVFRNGTAGAFQLFIKTTSGTAIQIPQGTTKWVMGDGANVLTRHDKREVGKIKMSGAAAVGAGELACDGSSKLRTDFPDLFTEIGTTWGAVDGTHFTMPNFTDTNRFIRAAGGSLTAGTYQSNQNKSHSHTLSGTTGTNSVDHTHTYSGTTATQSANHTHTVPNVPQVSGFNNNNGGGGGAFAAMASSLTTYGTSTESPAHTHTFSGTSSGASATHTHTVSGTTSSDGGTEARPEAAAVIFSITF